MQHVDEIARLETLDNGKPIFESRHIDMPAAAECFAYYAGWADKIHGETIPVKGNYFTYTLREPVGVVAAIVPWNFPLLLAAGRSRRRWPAATRWSSSPRARRRSPRSRSARSALEAGFPPGVLNVVTGRGARVGQAIVEHPGRRQDRVHRGYDRPAGRSCSGAAETLKRVTLELGGKSPNIVLRGRGHRRGGRGATIGHLLRQGRGLRRRLAPARRRSIHDEFIDKLAARAKKIVPGDPLDPKTRLGAIASKEQLESVLALHRDRRRTKARRSSPAARASTSAPARAIFVEPTVFAGVTPR